jgi:c-di-GMP-binding flagellar brake protein YcgR
MESMARAQIKLASSKEPLEGLIIHADKERIRVQLEQPQTCLKPIPSNTQVLIRIGTSKGAYQVDMIVEAHDKTELRLRFGGKPQLIQQRKHNRYDCDLRVKFRSAATDLLTDSWCEATALDIGQGGMRLVVEPGIRIPDHLEIGFWLLGAGTVTTYARVCGRRKEADGKQVVRVAFEQMEPKHQTLLCQIFP